MKILYLSLLISFSCYLQAKEQSNYDYTFAELANIEINTPSTLTQTRKREIPASVTLIDREMIESSGARNLDELLEIFVPALMGLRHNAVGPKLGIRGIIDSVDFRTLVLVNGHVMNDDVILGSIIERHFSMLGDIEYIEVIRGPGSAVYGPGAVSGIIHIHTFNKDSFEGFDVKVRGGFIEEFTNFEFRLGQKIDSESGFFLYYGIDDYRGSSSDNAPAISSVTIQSPFNLSGHPIDNILNDHKAYKGRTRHKFHLQFESGGFKSWLRYTRGGEEYLSYAALIEALDTVEYSNWGVGYDQWTWVNEYQKQLSETLHINFEFEYNFEDIESTRPSLTPGINLEPRSQIQKFHFGTLINWQPVEDHQLAFGLEYSYSQLGRFDTDSTGLDIFIPGFAGIDFTDFPSWNTYITSLLTEYQWRINEEWTTFLGMRLDQHKYTDPMFSPRMAFIYLPNRKDTWKLLLNRSVRRAGEIDMRVEHLLTGGKVEHEDINNIELIYSRDWNHSISTSIAAYYSNLEFFTFSSTEQKSALIGDLDLAGIDFELHYRNTDWHIVLSQSYTKLVNFKSDNRNDLQSISSEPFGAGDDLANWSNHISKLYIKYQVNDKLSLDASLRVFWHFPGAEDFTEFSVTNIADPTFPHSDGRIGDDAFDTSSFLNAGFTYKVNDKLKCRFDAINILGWIDKDYNKRNNFITLSEYRNEAAAVAISLEYKFL